MILTVKERLLLFQLLPNEGDILSLRMVRKLREDLSFSDEENAALQFKIDGPSYNWDHTAATTKEVEIGPKANALIAEALKRLSDARKLSIDHVDLWDKFIPATDVHTNGDG